MEKCKILSGDADQHQAFFRFIGSIFPGGRAETWTLWRDRGGWTQHYEVFALIDDGKIVSTIGRSRMQLVIHGETQTGYQLGAVATHAEHRGRGHARQLMGWVIDELDTPDQPMILFANNSVLNFYPRFGFRHVPRRRSTAQIVIEPSGIPAVRCDLSSAAERARLAKLCARAQPIRGPLAAHNYYWILLWNLTCGPAIAFWLSEFDAVIAASIVQDRLIVHDVIAPQPIDLKVVIPTLIAQPIRELEFMFDPDDWWPTANHAALDDTDARLFVRGGTTALAGPVQFPDLAHT
jgi:predicted N-acetyltransferase YhbS